MTSYPTLSHPKWLYRDLEQHPLMVMDFWMETSSLAVLTGNDTAIHCTDYTLKDTWNENIPLNSYSLFQAKDGQQVLM